MAAQLLLNGLVTGLFLALPALGLTLIFSIIKFANFAIGAMMTLGAYAAWTANVVFGLPFAAAALVAAVVVAFGALVADALVFDRLRDRGSITQLVASMGVSLVIENMCRFAFGNAPRNLDSALARPIRWGGLRVNYEQLITAAVVIACLLVLHFLLRRSRLGRAMRAVADNAALAAVRGVEVRTVTALTWVVVGALVGLAGVLAGLDRAIDPLLGWNYQIPVFAAAILGGLGSPAGAVLGALVIGITEEMSVLVLPTNYRQAVSFVVIVVLLMFRANGLLGVKVARA